MDQAPTETPPASPSLKPKYGFGPAFNFRLRLHIEGPFAQQSLWELAQIAEDGKELIISDADKLQNCLDNMVGVFQQEGY